MRAYLAHHGAERSVLWDEHAPHGAVLFSAARRARVLSCVRRLRSCAPLSSPVSLLSPLLLRSPAREPAPSGVPHALAFQTALSLTPAPLPRPLALACN